MGEILWFGWRVGGEKGARRPTIKQLLKLARRIMRGGGWGGGRKGAQRGRFAIGGREVASREFWARFWGSGGELEGRRG